MDKHPDRKSPQGKGLSKGGTWLILAAVLGLFVYVLFQRSPAPPPVPEGTEQNRIALGGELFGKNCAPCHGNAGEGEDPRQRRGGVKPDGTFLAPALNGTAHAWHHPPDALFGTVKNGSLDTQSPMKGWAGRMNDAEIGAVLSYIQSLWPDRIRNRYNEMHGGR